MAFSTKSEFKGGESAEEGWMWHVRWWDVRDQVELDLSFSEEIIL